jgi:hypothetical protein
MHHKLVSRDAIIILRVSHGALKRLDEQAGRFARDEREKVDRFVDGTALDEARCG